MAGSADLVIKVLADTSGATGEISKLQGTLGKALGIGAASGLVAATTQAATDLQSAMARIEVAYNSADFAPGTAKYVETQNTILQKSTELATSFDDLATVYGQGARFIDDFGNRLPTDKLNEYVDTMVRLSKVSSDQLSPEAIGQQTDVLAKLFGTSDFSKLGSEISALSGMHNKGEGPGLDAAIAIGQSGADIGVSQEQALALGNYLADLGLGGQTGGSSIGRLLQRTGSGIEQLDPEQSYKDLKTQRDAGEKADDLQRQLAVAEQRRSQMYGQHGLKTAYKRDPAAVMAADNEIAKLQREISDTQQDNAHLGTTKSASTSSANIGAMAGLLGTNATDFAAQFQNDPISALLQWTHAVGQLPENERLAAMTKAFGTRGGTVNVRDQKVIQALANPDRQDSLSSYLDAAAGQAANPTDLVPRSDRILGTTASKATDALNAVQGGAAVAGDPARQALDAGLTSVLTDVRKDGFQPFEDKINSATGAVEGFGNALKPITDFLSNVPAPVLTAGGVLAGKFGPGAVGAAAGAVGVGGALAGAAGLIGVGAFGSQLLDNVKLLQDEIDTYNKNIAPKTGAPPITINIGDVMHGGHPEELLQQVKDALTAAWTAATSGQPVSGQVGGNYTSGQGPR